MKKLISSLLLAVATSTVAFSASAAPYHQHVPLRHTQHDAKWQQHQHDDRQQRYRQFKPTQHWRVGTTLPKRYQSSQYVVDYRSHRLSKPNRHQQWLRVSGDYVLVNVKNHKIVRLIHV